MLCSIRNWQAVDAIDNGVNQFDSDGPPKYISNTHLGARVGRLNPNWMQPSSEELENACFRQASKLAGEEVRNLGRNCF
jgi:hypothetical protein